MRRGGGLRDDVRDGAAVAALRAVARAAVAGDDAPDAHAGPIAGEAKTRPVALDWKPVIAPPVPPVPLDADAAAARGDATAGRAPPSALVGELMNVVIAPPSPPIRPLPPAPVWRCRSPERLFWLTFGLLLVIEPPEPPVPAGRAAARAAGVVQRTARRADDIVEDRIPVGDAAALSADDAALPAVPAPRPTPKRELAAGIAAASAALISPIWRRLGRGQGRRRRRWCRRTWSRRCRRCCRPCRR